MESISTAFCALHCRTASHQLAICNRKKLGVSENALDFRTIARSDLDRLQSNCGRYRRRFLLRAVSEFGGRTEVEKLKVEAVKLVGRLKETISAFPSVNFRVFEVQFNKGTDHIETFSPLGNSGENAPFEV